VIIVDKVFIITNSFIQNGTDQSIAEPGKGWWMLIAYPTYSSSSTLSHQILVTSVRT